MTQESIVLEMLKSGMQTTIDFCQHPKLAAEYRRAISTLRRKGYIIQCEAISRNNFRYALLSEPECKLKVTLDEKGQFSFA